MYHVFLAHMTKKEPKYCPSGNIEQLFTLIFTLQCKFNAFRNISPIYREQLHSLCIRSALVRQQSTEKVPNSTQCVKPRTVYAPVSIHRKRWLQRCNLCNSDINFGCHVRKWHLTKCSKTLVAALLYKILRLSQICI